MTLPPETFNSHERVAALAPTLSIEGGLVRKRLLASLIVCVALLTQLGASFWGAAAARDGIAPCHRVMTVSATTQGDAAGKSTGAPAPHDHASCSLCQLGFSVVNSDAPVFVAENLAYHFRVALTEPDFPAPRAVFNRSAPARAPPSSRV
jgi:hypothetical protein